MLVSAMRYMLILIVLVAACSDRDPELPIGDASPPDAIMVADAMSDAEPPPEDAACASVFVEASLDRGPVDIIWMVDNSPSMEPAIEEVRRGLNDFAELIAAGAGLSSDHSLREGYWAL